MSNKIPLHGNAALLSNENSIQIKRKFNKFHDKGTIKILTVGIKFIAV